MRALALSQSSLDYVDLHTYPTGRRYSLTKDLESAEIGLLAAEKPRIIGEVGALRFAYRDGLAAALLLANHQSASCAHGIRGWVLWTWDSDAFDEPGFWNALENNGAINRVLAPVNRPDGCSPTRALPIDRLGDSARDFTQHPLPSLDGDGDEIAGWSQQPASTRRPHENSREPRGPRCAGSRPVPRFLSLPQSR